MSQEPFIWAMRSQIRLKMPSVAGKNMALSNKNMEEMFLLAYMLISGQKFAFVNLLVTKILFLQAQNERLHNIMGTWL